MLDKYVGLRYNCIIVNRTESLMSDNIDNAENTENSRSRLFPVKATGKESVIIFFVVILLIIGLTFSMWAIRLVNSYAARLCLTLLVIAAYTAVAVMAMILTGQAKILLPTKNRLWLQILIGIGIAAVLCFVMGIVPILCGTSLIGSHSDMSAAGIILSAVQDILFVGVGEETVFRGYIQNQFTVWLKKCKWLSPLIAAVIFGLWHLINGNIIQVLFTTLIGCVFGYARYFIKDCSLLSAIIAHGLYDFSLVLLTCFML